MKEGDTAAKAAAKATAGECLPGFRNEGCPCAKLSGKKHSNCVRQNALNTKAAAKATASSEHMFAPKKKKEESSFLGGLFSKVRV